MWSIVSEADRALGELAGLGRRTSHPQLLIQPYIRHEAVLSSRIEGTRADLKDVYAFEAGQSTGEMPQAVPADAQEVHNYVVATEFGLEQIERRPVTLSLLRQLHERLLHGVRGGQDRPGEFRDVQNWVGTSNDIAQARYVPPPVIQMRDALESFEQYLAANDDLPPVVRLAVIHYQFEAIHPFRDGNGRIGRLLIILLLVHWNILPSHLLYLSAYLERERQRYYDLLLAVTQRGAWEDWITFFAKGVSVQARDAASRAGRLEDLREAWRRKLVKLHAPQPAHQLCDRLFERPFVTVPDAAEFLDVAYNTARAAIDRLVKAEILRPFGKMGKSQFFVTFDIAEALHGRAPAAAGADNG